MAKKTVEIEWALAHVRAATSKQLAAAFISGVDNAVEEGHALSQVQQIDMLALQIMAYHDLVTQLTESFDMEWQLSRLKKNKDKES